MGKRAVSGIIPLSRRGDPRGRGGFWNILRPLHIILVILIVLSELSPAFAAEPYTPPVETLPQIIPAASVSANSVFTASAASGSNPPPTASSPVMVNHTAASGSIIPGTASSASAAQEPTLQDKFNAITPPPTASDTIDIEADNISYGGDLAYADGDVVITYKDVEIKTGSISVNKKEKTTVGNDYFEMKYKGDSGGNEGISGKSLNYDFKTRVGSFSDATMIQGAPTPNQKIYIIAKKLTSENRKTYKFDDSYITTCRYFDDDRHEHYHLWATSGWYTPKKQMILFNVIVYIGSTPVMYTPIWYISLRKRQFINIGSNNTEGTFVKSGLEYEIDDNNYGLLLNDNMSIKGWGSGIEHTYQQENDSFTGMLWQLREQDTGLDSYKYKVSYGTKFGDNIKNQLTVDDRNTYSIGGFGRDNNATYSDNWSYNNQQTALSLGYNQSVANRNVMAITNYNNTLNFSTPIASMTTLMIQGNQASNTYAQTNILNNTNTVTNNQPWGTISFNNTRSYDLSASAAALYLGRSFVDRDDLRVTYNQLKVDDRILTNTVTAASIKDKVSGRPEVTGKALYYDMTIGAKPIYLLGFKELSFDIANSGWKQSVYETGDAQYSIVENYSLTNRLSPEFSLTTTYHKDDISPVNNTPFISADRLYAATHFINSAMTIASSSGDFNYNWTTRGGFNYLSNYADAVTTSLNFNIGKRQNYSFQFGIDPNQYRQLPLTFAVNLKSNDTGTFSTFGDEKMESAWTLGVNGTIDPNKNTLMSLSNNLSYDYGSSWIDHFRLTFSGTFDNLAQLYKISSITLVKDFHDMQFTVTYNPLGETYMFELKSIAFPQGSISATQSPQFGTSFGVGGITIPK